MADLFLRKGLLADLTADKYLEGSLNFTTDEPAIYIDVDGEHKRIGDIKEFANMEALKAYLSTTPGKIPTTGLYYAIAENALMKWTGTEWQQINEKSDFSGDISALQSAVNAAQAAADKAQGEVDALEGVHAADKKTLQDGIDAVAGDLADHLSAYATKMAALDAKDTEHTNGIASANNAIAAEKSRAEGVEADLDGRLDVIEGNIGEGTVDSRIAAAKSAAETAAKSHADSIVATEKARAEAAEKKNAGDISSLNNALSEEVTRAKAAEGANTTAINSLKDQVGTGTVDSRIATAKEAAITAAKGETEAQVAAEAVIARAAEQANADAIASLENLVGEETVDSRIATAKSGAITAAKTETTTQVGVEKARAEGEEAKIREEFAAADEALAGRIADLESNKNSVASTLNGVAQDIANLKAADTTIRGEFASADEAVLGEAKTYAENQAKAVRGETTETVASVDTKIGNLSNTVSNNYNALDGKISTEKTRAEGEEAKIREEFANADAALKTEITGEYEAYVDGKLQAADAMKFKGVVNAAADLPTTGVEAGWTYKVGTNFTLNGVNVYVGDLLIAESDQGSDVASYPASGWAHVASGYEDDHDVHVELDGKKVSVVNAAGQNRGSVEFAAAANTGVTVAVAQVAKDEQSGVTDVKVTVGLEWGSF